MTRRIVVTDPADPPSDGEALFYDAASDTWVSSDPAHLRQVSDSLYPEVILERADAGPALVDDDDVLGRVLFRGYDGADYVDAAEIRAVVDTVSGGSGDIPSELIFSTHPDGGGAMVARWRIGSGGSFTPVTDASVNLGGPSTRPLTIYTAQGIQFPATQNPSSDANNLDDYEEGTWTPGFAFGGGTTGITYALQFGTYTKVGRMVFARMTCAVTSNGSSAGVMTVTGLPFASSGAGGDYNAAAIGYQAGFSATVTGAINEPGTTTLRPFKAGATQIVDTDTTDAADLTLSLTYHV